MLMIFRVGKTWPTLFLGGREKSSRRHGVVDHNYGTDWEQERILEK